MSFETGTATGHEDLTAKWFNFLQANGWTADVDYAAAGQSPSYGVIHRQNQLSPEDENTVNLYCGFAPVGFSSSYGDLINMIPMRDYSGSGDPNLGTEVGTSSSTYADTGATHIRTGFPTDPFENYWFFESDYYAHAVVEFAVGYFRHFGMGAVNKIGRWFGGEYYYGSVWDQSPSFIENKFSGQHAMCVDSVSGFAAAWLYGRQLDGTGFPDVVGRQSPETAWHVAQSLADNGAGSGALDADGRQKGTLFSNGPRGGLHYPLYLNGISPFNGYRSMFPIHLWTTYRASSPDNYRPVGVLPDIRNISMEGSLQGGDEFTIGSDTWLAFPVARKQTANTADNLENSGLYGLAYKKVTT